MTDQITPEQIELYGADAAEWLKRWDAGDIVWTIEMGGMGPGYEQCIQITAAEVLRYLVENKVDAATQYKGDAWKTLSDEINKSLWANKIINNLGLSGAQAGAARSLAIKIYVDGPAVVLTDEHLKDRRIQCSRKFPQAA